MDATEKIADWLTAQPFARNRATDERHTVVEVEVAELATSLIAAFPQLALEGRDEWGGPDEVYLQKRTVWESPWSEVQS